MKKKPISVTLSPDNLVWLKGQTRIDGVASLSECLDRLLTRARCGQEVPKPYQSMKGALATVGHDLPEPMPPAVSATAWATWRAKWDVLLDGVDLGQVPTFAKKRMSSSSKAGGRG